MFFDCPYQVAMNYFVLVHWFSITSFIDSYVCVCTCMCIFVYIKNTKDQTLYLITYIGKPWKGITMSLCQVLYHSTHPVLTKLKNNNKKIYVIKMVTEGRRLAGELSTLIIISVIQSMDEHVIFHLFCPHEPHKIIQVRSLTELQGYVNARIYSLSLI